MTTDEFAHLLPADLDDIERLLNIPGLAIDDRMVRRLVARVRELEAVAADWHSRYAQAALHAKKAERERDELAAALQVLAEQPEPPGTQAHWYAVRAREALAKLDGKEDA